MSQDNDENLNSLNEEKHDDTQDTDDTSDKSKEVSLEGMTAEEQITYLKEQNRLKDESKNKLFERAKKAEGFTKQPDGTWVKKPKPEVKPQPVPITTPPDQLSEELKLIARGLSDEEIAEAKDIAKGKGITLSEALKTKPFMAFQKELKEEERKEKAKLGASKGSGQAEKSELKPNMTTEEHKEVWKKALGQ